MSAMQTPPDPMAQAAAYQQLLLAALGTDDPAEVQSHDGELIGAGLNYQCRCV